MSGEKADVSKEEANPTPSDLTNLNWGRELVGALRGRGRGATLTVARSHKKPPNQVRRFLPRRARMPMTPSEPISGPFG